jgi:2-phosphosulfolactate phosphatase
MLRSVEEALALREAGIGQICMGEVHGRAWRHKPPVSPPRGEAPDGFDFGNSLFEISTIDFGGKTIIQRTSAGTQGIVAASRSERLYAASLVMAEATVRALLWASTDQVSLYTLDEMAERPRRSIEFPDNH